ncbi:sugar ABC transporter permease [Streptococcus suis]|uniref:sugar ABC transporter permease n=1 Tax=Streptococcus TaxID=1301 RepID=UPI000CF41DA2|nr:sugar ABC transporter permease [Streptococcus suis]MBY4972402.1 sugar ABC transporter permease [Streptococcus suis]MBY5010566.1 sugar ABC transporter permease [Streptococcus suis]MDG4518163.1 sugar ABC transporter permease [Streptococcus suis]BCP57990.1 putative maltodextrin transport system permease [Streptococcus parasuis]
MNKSTFRLGMKRRKALSTTATYLFLILVSIIILFPILVTISSAFKFGNNIAFTLNLNSNWTFSNFNRLFHETDYLNWYKNTLIVAFWTMVVQVSIVTLTGYSYSRYQFVGKKNSLLFFLIIQMVPTTASLTAFFVVAWLFNALNQYWFLIMIYVGAGIPMNAWLMKGYFDTVPYDLDESAKLDGAGHLKIFYRVVLPLVKPMIAVQALWAFMGPFGDFMLAKFLLRKPEYYTVAIGLQTFISDSKKQEVTLFASGAILVAIPISILFFFLQKNFVSGLTAGGTKG